jgi:hypothetical protein
VLDQVRLTGHKRRYGNYCRHSVQQFSLSLDHLTVYSRPKLGKIGVCHRIPTGFLPGSRTRYKGSLAYDRKFE